jgi:hypothetical protein
VRVVYGCVTTSVLNTTEEEVNITEPVVRVTKLDTGDLMLPEPKSPANRYKCRDERVLNKLRMEHLKSEEQTSLGEICLITRVCSFNRGTV